MRLIGTTLGKYRITEHLGSGGMSEVYKAYQPGLDRYVAIKVLHSFLAQEEDFLTRFQREAKFAAMLRHPSIIQVYDFDYDKETNAYYMVMEYIDGPSLKVRLQKMDDAGDTMPMNEAIGIVIAIANALDYAHQHGTVHRDVKPANIMFNQDVQPILTDFGIAKMVDVVGLTASGAMVGTPAYMAPEQGMGQPGDERSDIYSLGVVLYQLVTGRRPFDADTPLGVALKHINAPLPPPSDLNIDLPPSIESVTMRALAKNPDNRYQTAKELATELKQAVAGEYIEPPPPEPVVVTMEPLMSATVPQEQKWEMATLPTAPAIRPVTAKPKPMESLIALIKPPWVAALVAVAALILIGAIILLATGTGRRMLAALRPQTPTPTSTVAPGTPTPTYDVVATQVAAALATYVATTGVTPTPSPTPTDTPTPTPTPTADLTATALAACVFDLEVVNNPPVWPTVLAPDQQFVKRWTVQNTGTCAWPEGVQLVFASGNEPLVVDGPTIEPLAPGETADVRITLRAPTGHDTYTSAWQLQDGTGSPIGEELKATYRVGPTPTPTASPTPESTPTPTEPLRMSYPALTWCNGPPRTKGRIGWSHWGGPSEEYHYFYGTLSPEQELEGPYREFEGFPHIETYLTVSGSFTFPLPENCGRGEYGRCGSSEEGYEIVWQKVYIKSEDCGD
jgi:predicted Ser/Thr protein kinase